MKTVIVGMNNPYSIDPRMALYPYPENSAGARLCAMFLMAAPELNRDDYKHGFDRRNLINTLIWDTSVARARGDQVFKELQGRRVIMCGTAVLGYLRLPRLDWLNWGKVGAVDYALIPHPSGRCREYNDPDMVQRVGGLLLEEWKRGR